VQRSPETDVEVAELRVELRPSSLGYDSLEQRPSVRGYEAVATLAAANAKVTEGVEFDFDLYEAFSLRQGPQVTRAPSEQNSIQSAQYLGRRLFEALFGGKLGTMYELSRLESQGLRVRIVLPHHDRAARLPWELLYEGPSDCRQGDFVALV
jgi:hypothetical protein